MEDEYIIINKTAILKRIEELDRLYKNSEKPSVQATIYNQLSIELKQILSQSTRLIPEIEKAFNSAREFNSLDGVVDIDIVVGFHSETKDLQGVYINSKDYISNLKLDI